MTRKPQGAWARTVAGDCWIRKPVVQVNLGEATTIEGERKSSSGT
ncbi:hypothetical protein chiPu_0024582, partial [Chiloscyllium punctatum]|nr:hypothetical protein [Chiloscyllium punctatum]